MIGTAILLIAMINERAVASYQSAAQTDFLTGLMMRGPLLSGGTELMADTFADGKPLALAIFDLDHFKSINDTFGHQTGDVVLERFAETASAGLRPHDLIGRIGGEEFLAVIPGAGEKAATAIAERIRQTFAKSSTWIDGRPVQATVSIGIAIGRPNEGIERLEHLLDVADKALYAAKDGGRNSVSLAAEPIDPVAASLPRIA